jgi:hypothetical protein
MLLAVHDGRLKLEQIPQLLAENPRRIFGAPTQADTYTDIETESRWNIDRAKLHTACGWSPFEGMTVFGKVERVVIRGQVAYDGEQVCVGAGFGRNLFARFSPSIRSSVRCYSPSLPNRHTIWRCRRYALQMTTRLSWRTLRQQHQRIPREAVQVGVLPSAHAWQLASSKEGLRQRA